MNRCCVRCPGCWICKSLRPGGLSDQDIFLLHQPISQASNGDPRGTCGRLFHLHTLCCYLLLYRSDPLRRWWARAACRNKYLEIIKEPKTIPSIAWPDWSKSIFGVSILNLLLLVAWGPRKLRRDGESGQKCHELTFSWASKSACQSASSDNERIFKYVTNRRLSSHKEV